MKKMKKVKHAIIQAKLPLLPGSISTATSTCGKPNCACHSTPPKLHGPYHRWTGFLEGKRTTITITPEQACECQKRIRNFRALEKQVSRLLAQALKEAPWNEPRSKAKP